MTISKEGLIPGSPQSLNTLVDRVQTEVDALSGITSYPTGNSTITLGSTGAATQTATIQLKNAANANIADIRAVRIYLSGDPNNLTISSTAAATSTTVTTGSAIVTQTANLVFDAISNASGVVALTVNNTGGGASLTDRVVLVLPNGDVVMSGALDVATA